MKKIGFLTGMDSELTFDLMENINSRGLKNVKAELIKTGGITLNNKCEYDVILDRVSHDVPFFVSYLKSAEEQGVKILNFEVINSPEDYFQLYCKLDKLKIKIPKTVVLPSKHHPPGTNAEFMKNFIYPLNWEEIFEYVGFPAYIKPNRYNIFAKSHIVYNEREFFSIYDLTGSDVMLIQEYIEYDEYYRIYNIGSKQQRIMNYDPNLQLKARFTDGQAQLDKDLEKKIKSAALKINKAFNVEFNAIEIALKNGEPYFTEFINIDPYSSMDILKPDNYNWLLENLADFLIQKLDKK